MTEEVVLGWRQKPLWYKLVNKKPVPCKTIQEWTATTENIVKKTHLFGFEVSTVFLAIDHNYSGKGDPILFETMIFSRGGKHDKLDQWQNRYCSWDDAVAGHESAVQMVRRKIRLKIIWKIVAALVLIAALIRIIVINTTVNV